MTAPADLGSRRTVTTLALRWGVFCGLLLAFILVPFALLEGRMTALTQQALGANLPLALITLSVIGLLLVDIALPVPSSFVLSTTGYLLGAGLGTLICFVGMSCATLAGYALGRYAGGPLAHRILGRAQLDRFAALVSRHGDLVLVSFRAVPVLAEATAILAGISHMPLGRFVVLTSVGNLVVSFTYAWIGATSAGQASFLFASVASIVLPILVVLAARWAARTAV